MECREDQPVTRRHIPEERSLPRCKILRNEFIDSGCTQNHGGGSCDQVMDLPVMWLTICCGFLKRSRQRKCCYIYIKKPSIFAYMDVVSTRLFSKAKDEPRSWRRHGQTGNSRREALLNNGVRCVQIALHHCHLWCGNVISRFYAVRNTKSLRSLQQATMSTYKCQQLQAYFVLIVRISLY
jgi:hypothetical protein